ncbi:MAG: hypothetical protein JO129_04475 [Candidatus Dependentiae bacterium]|nr:hypothetical protein [Candidatus Dependentiae bacterium]
MKNVQIFLMLFLMTSTSNFLVSSDKKIVMEASSSARNYFTNKQVATPSALREINRAVSSLNQEEALMSVTKEDTLRNRRVFVNGRLTKNIKLAKKYKK